MDLFKNHKAYTLVEMLVTMAIFGVVLIVLTNLIFSAVRISEDIQTRSKYRDQMTELLDLIKRDIRNVDNLGSCSGSSCSLTIDNTITWQVCPSNIGVNSICKFEQQGTESVLLKKTPSFIYIKTLRFETLTVESEGSSNVANSSIIVTIEAIPYKNLQEFEDARNGAIPFDVRQIIVSTRNVQL